MAAIECAALTRGLRPDGRAPRAQRGQAAIEFVFILLIILGLAAVLYQAMHFELDVFNKMGMLRYKVMKEAHEDQDETEMETIDNITVQGKNLDDLTPYSPPLQDVDGTMHYGPKKLVIKHGTKYWDPISFMHSFWEWSGLLLLTHEEDAANAIDSVLGSIGDMADSIPDF
jgi:hypothetical protein